VASSALARLGEHHAKDAMKNIVTEKKAKVLIATMNRGKANALGTELVNDLLELLDIVRRDEELRAVLLASGTGQIFCAGFDVEQVFAFDRPALHHFISRFVDVLEGLRSLPQAVVVELSGHAFAGGALLALCGDLRTMADESALFSIPEADLGVNMPLELTGWLAPIPHGVLREMLLCARPVNAQRAYEIGLVQRVVSRARLREESLRLCERLSGKAPNASMGIKAGLNELAGGIMSPSRRREFVDKFVDSFLSDESVLYRRRLAASLGKSPR
jgi:enoyl-CoA hydratase